jgi:3-hydroxyacyl-[acyl-carrier-protein] dehydratase
VRHFHLDRVTSLERGVRAIGVRSVALSDDVFAEHFPGNPVLPGVYVLEGLAQTAGVLLWETTDHARIALMTSVDRARFAGFARPGEVVQFAVEIESLDEDAARVLGTATVADRTVATARITFSLQEPDRLIPPLLQPFWHQAADVWLGRYPGTESHA